MRQKRAFLPDMQFAWSYTINPDYQRDMFFTQFLPSTVSHVSGANSDATTALLPAVPPAVYAPTVVVEEIFADLMYAVPRVSIPRGPSIHVPYQALTVYHRQLTAASTFTEVFSGIPASCGGIVVALRDPAHCVNYTNVPTRSMPDHHRALCPVARGVAAGIRALMPVAKLGLPRTPNFLWRSEDCRCSS